MSTPRDAIARPEGAGRSPHFDLFDTLRILASIAVIYFHSYALTGRADPIVPLLGRTGLGWGSIAVGAFFAMSGFMVSASWVRATPFSYARNRVFRIYPGLIAVVVLSSVVLGPLVTTLPVGQYFRSSLTWSYTFHTSTLFPVAYHLPGVFAHLPYPIAVNGSLWTLTYEVTAYVVLAGVGLVGLLRRRTFPLVLAATILLYALTIESHVLQQRTFHSFTLQDTVRLALFFEIGTACFLYKDELLRRRWVSGLAAVAAIVIGSLVRSQGLASAGLAVGIVVLGTRSSAPARRLRTLGDPSYGIYIYAFPIQQLLVWSGAVHSPMVMFPIATAASVAAGYASWHLIERPVMDWGKRHVRSRAARRPVDLREPTPVGSVTRSVG